MDKKLIEEINLLAKKKREQGLNQEETARQKQLYKEYLAQFRAQFDQQLDNIDVKTPDGKITPLKQFGKEINKKEKK
ncbi:MAG: DUF896 domain-containing protein [Ruminococcus sp.]